MSNECTGKRTDIDSPSDLACPAPRPQLQVTEVDELISRNKDIVSDREQATLRSTRLLVAGCGSVGGSIVEPLVRLGIGFLALADPEEYSLSNMNRQACFLQDLGRPKVQVLSGRAASINPFVETVTYPNGITADNVDEAIAGISIAFDGIDAGAAPWEKYLLHERACALGIPVLSGIDFGGKAVIYIFDYRRPGAKPFYGMATAEAHRKHQFVECMRWLEHRHFPADFLPVVADRILSSKPWPQVSYCATAMATLATRCILNVAMGRSIPHVVSFDAHMSTRTMFARQFERLRLPFSLARTLCQIGHTKRLNTPTNEKLDRLLKSNVEIRTAVEAIRLAPSAHNTQPWVLTITSPRELRISWNIDRGFLPNADSQTHGVAYSLGCAIEAAASIVDVEFEPSNKEDLFASDYYAGTLRVRGLTSETYARCSGLLEKRCTNRWPYLLSSISTSIGSRCATAASIFGATAKFGDPPKKQLASLVYKGALALFRQPDYTQELFAHLRLSKKEELEHGTGMTPKGLALDWASARGVQILRGSSSLRAVTARLGVAQFMAMSSATIVKESGGFVTISTTESTTQGRINAGRAMMKVWLELTKFGYVCQPLDFAICTEENRRQIRRLFNLGDEHHLVTLLRVGRAMVHSHRLSPRLSIPAYC